MTNSNQLEIKTYKFGNLGDVEVMIDRSGKYRAAVTVERPEAAGSDVDLSPLWLEFQDMVEKELGSKGIEVSYDGHGKSDRYGMLDDSGNISGIADAVCAVAERIVQEPELLARGAEERANRIRQQVDARARQAAETQISGILGKIDDAKLQEVLNPDVAGAKDKLQQLLVDALLASQDKGPRRY